MLNYLKSKIKEIQQGRIKPAYAFACAAEEGNHDCESPQKPGFYQMAYPGDIYVTGEELTACFRDGDEEFVDDIKDPNYEVDYRQWYRGFIKKLYLDFKKKHINEPCALCGGKYYKGFLEGDKQWGFSIDHKISVKHHYNSLGGNKHDYKANKEWFNDINNWQPAHRSCNSRKGG